MFQNVLVPMDRSVESEGVLDVIPGLVDPDGQAVLLTVIPPGRTKSMGEFVILGSQQEEEDRIRAMAYLTRIANRLKESSVNATAAVVVDTSVASAIVGYANQQDIDLISMYSHDRKGLARLMKGSVARDVENRASTVVKVYRPDDLAVPTAAQPDAGEEGSAEAIGLRGVDLFDRLTDDQVTKVVALGQLVQISEGEKLGQGGKLGQRLFIILDGEAHLTAHSEIGEIAVRIAVRGESFPLAVLLGEGTLITAGEALTEMSVLEIPRAPLLELCASDSAIGMGIYAGAAQLFANRYSATLTQLGLSAARELRDNAP